MTWKNKIKFTFIDLFAWIWGFRIGLEHNGWTCIGFSEINKDAIETYCTNFSESSSLNFGDITRINDLPKHDLLTGWVPCQSWSIAWRNLWFDDDRWQLWNDTIFLLNKTRPKAFIFENVKGLSDPRNSDALDYILNRIKEAWYYATYFILNSYDYWVLQNRVRIYIIGFKEEKFLEKLKCPSRIKHGLKLWEILKWIESNINFEKQLIDSKELFWWKIPKWRTRFQKHNELNDFFLFNDIRNWHTTIHSWDLEETTTKEKYICDLLLKNRRKKQYWDFDGNSLSLEHFKSLDKTIAEEDIKGLLKKWILKTVESKYRISRETNNIDLTVHEKMLLDNSKDEILDLDLLKKSRKLKIEKITFSRILPILKKKWLIECIEVKYDFKHSKISSGINGINRIYLPSSDIFSTLVASDSNDYVALKNIEADNPISYKEIFIKEIYKKWLYRKITKEEACIIQGFSENFDLPANRARWMKLLGNSVSVPVIENLWKAIVETGVFD